MVQLSLACKESVHGSRVDALREDRTGLLGGLHFEQALSFRDARCVQVHRAQLAALAVGVCRGIAPADALSPGKFQDKQRLLERCSAFLSHRATMLRRHL